MLFQTPTFELIPAGMSLDEYLTQTVLNRPVETLWREQPHLRTVVGFIARNIASLGLHVYERDDDNGRNRVRDTPLANLLYAPNGEQTAYELIYGTVASMCLYDQAYWYVAPDEEAPNGWVIRQIPNKWIIAQVGGTAFSVGAYRIALPSNPPGKFIQIPANQMVVFRGWNPLDMKSGTSPVHALKAVLAEQIHAAVFRDQMWQRGGRVGSYLTRPADAPQWSDAARARFVENWQSSYAGDQGPKAGGTPLLEEGMRLESNRFSAKDEQFIEAAKLSLETCCQVFYVNPTMIGMLDNANYSNVREFRRMLYGDNLGPIIEQFQQRINRSLVPQLVRGEAVARTYVEFNLASKLNGSFEEQAELLSKSIGAPWMTVNEGRSKQNMSHLPGGDELIRPLNVTQNGDQNPVPAEPAPQEEPTVPKSLKVTTYNRQEVAG
jgi:HK97 family phage portal protein